MEIYLHNNVIFVLNCPFFHRPFDLSSLSLKPQIQKSIIRARNHNIRSGSLRLRQFVLDSMPIIASNQAFLPEPLNVFDRESGGCHQQTSFSGTTWAQNSVIYARKNRRRSGSQRTTRFVLESMSIIASKLNILPEPLNVVIREFGGGNGGGGGSGFWKSFGGGGFEGWRRRKRKLGLFGLLSICCLIVLLGKEFESDLFWGILGFALFAVSIYFCKIRFQDSVFGICCCLGLVGLGMRKERVGKWVEKFKVYSPLMEAVRRRRKKCRRAM